MLWIQIFEMEVESFYPEYNEYNELAQCYLNELYVHEETNYAELQNLGDPGDHAKFWKTLAW